MGNYASPVPPSQQYYPPPRLTNGMAVTSMIIGIFTWVASVLIACPTVAVTYGIGALVCWPILFVGWVLGLFMGYVGRNQIRNSGGAQTGDGMAVTGIVLGWIGVGLTLLVIVLAVLLSLCTLVLGIMGVAVGSMLPTPTPWR